MYIGKVKLSNQWEKLEDLIKAQVSSQSSFAFDADTTYQLQGEGNYGIRLCDAAAEPTDKQDGERIIETQTALYKEGDGVLYVKTEQDIPTGNVYLKISTLEGE